MIFSEYIYTSWKNGGVGSGFLTFAKGEDVTTEEWEEIVGLMSYTKPVGTPDRPTPEEIAAFPRNNAYFTLRSGRYCMAQASYVGEDYAVDVNARWANYIIHAFLFGSPDGAAAAAHIGSDLYRTGLTPEEREYPGITVTPPVEMETPDVYDFAEDAIMEIVSLGETGEFFAFLQGVLDSFAADSNLLVGIKDREKIGRFLKGMTIVLPKLFLDGVTYGTYLLYKEPRFRVNFLYNFETFDVASERAACPQNIILFFDSGEYYGDTSLCPYLAEYRDALLRNRMSAFRLKEDLDYVYSCDPTLPLDEALTVRHFIRRNVDYFEDFSLFERITVYVLGSGAYSRASETAMYMIQNSNFDDSDKRRLFYIGDVFLQLEDNEKDAVRGEFFRECFLEAENAAEFVERYESNEMVTGEYSPLTGDFFRQFTDYDQAVAEKVLRFVVELERFRFDEFDQGLRNYYFRIAEEYFRRSLKAGDYITAESCICAMKEREDGQRAGMTGYVITELIEDGVKCWGNPDFGASMMRLVSDDRDAYWNVFKAVLDAVNGTDAYGEFLDSYAKLWLENGEEFDEDITANSERLGFGEHLFGLNYRIFVNNTDKNVYDYASVFGSLFGSGRPYENRIAEKHTFYEEFSRHLENAAGGGVFKGANIHMWMSELSVFISQLEYDAANYELLDFITSSLAGTLPIEKFDSVSDVCAGLTTIREWFAYRQAPWDHFELTLYLDAASVCSKTGRTNYPPMYLENLDAMFAGVNERSVVPFIRGIVPSVFRDPAMRRQELNMYISPLFVFKSYKYMMEVCDAIVDGFDHVVENGTVEPVEWLVDFYVDRLSQKRLADEIEESLIFKVLAKHRKEITAIAEQNVHSYPRIQAYLEGLTFNVFGKAKRVEPMRLK